MLFLRSWLEEYIDLSTQTDQQISDLLSLRSGECESVQTITDYFDGKVLVGRIENLQKHPEADRLNIFEVNLGGNKKVQIVSAAPNARNGLICPVAIDGAKLPYLTVIPRKMRGVESQGMCCGKSELALETEFSDGLWELNDILKDTLKDTLDESHLGQSICQVLPDFFPSQTVFEIKYLQDKLSSCANHLGLAIEIARCLQQPELLKGVAQSIWNGEDFWSDKVKQIQPAQRQINLVDNTHQNNIYNLFSIELAKEYILDHNWQLRLFLTGKNLIGGLADLSNYFLFDFGQPNHFFSGSKIESNNWSFDTLQTQTSFNGLGNFKKANLPKGLTVMQNENQILIVPGVTGSESTKVENSDTQALVEITNFPAQLVARNSFAINYRSDSAKFFASGVEANLQLVFLVKLMQISNIKITHSLLWNQGQTFKNIDSWLNNFLAKNKIGLDLNYITSRLDQRGLEFWQPIVLKKLEYLGKVETKDDQINLTPEPFYSKITTNEDVLFELSKLIGFENLKPDYLTFAANSRTDDYQKTLDNLKLHCVNFGFKEVLTRPFLAENRLLSSLTNQTRVALDAISSQRADEPFLRDSLFSSLMQVISKNIQLGQKEINVFELTRLYTHQQSKPNQFSQLIDTGNTYENWSLSAISTSQDPYLLTSLINSLFKKMNLKAEIKLQPVDQNIVQNNLGQTTIYTAESKISITLTEIANKFKKIFEIPLSKKIWFVDISFIPENITLNTYNSYQDQSQFPTVKRSISWLVSKEISWLQVEQQLNLVATDFVVNIVPVERFSQDEKNDVLNLNLTFTSYSQTLTSQQVDSWLEEAINLCQKLGNLKNR
jgi:phenylalanyl-tRNA synthetase beta chain